MSQLLLPNGTVGLACFSAVRKIDLGRLPSCSYYPDDLDWQCKPCVDLRNAKVGWNVGRKTRADGWPKLQSDYGRRFQCTRPATRPPLPKVSVIWGGLPEQEEVVLAPQEKVVELCEPCSPSHNTPPPRKKRRVHWGHQWKERHEEEMKRVSTELQVTQDKLQRTVTRLQGLKQRFYQAKKQRLRNFVSEIGSVSGSIEKVLHFSMPKCKDQTKLTALLDIVFNNELFNGEHEEIISKRVKERSKALFDAWRVLKSMDQIGGGSFNYKCCDTARKSQTDIERHERGIFPSSSAVQSRAKALNAYAQQIIPFKRGTSTLWKPHTKDFSKTQAQCNKVCRMIDSSIANFHSPVKHGTPRKVWHDEHPCPLTLYGIFCRGLNLFIKEPPSIVTYGESG
jgi:hypothetical protein